MNLKDIHKAIPDSWKNSGTNILYYGDPHYTNQKPSTRLDDFEETEFNKIKEMIKIADEYNVKLYINPGDMTDKPRLNNDYLTKLMGAWGFLDIENSRKDYDAGLISKDELTEKLLKYRPTISLIGNHDLNFRKENSGSALRFLSEQKFLHLVTETEPYILKLNNGSTLAISGTPYWIGQMDGTIDPKIFTPNHNIGDVKIHLNHNNVYSKEFQEGLPWVDSRDVATVTDADLTLNGHIHLDDVPVQSKDKKHIVWNPGAIAQVSASPSELNRTIQVLLIHIQDDNTLDIRAIPLNTPKSKDIFDLTKKANKISIEKQLNQVKKIIAKVDDIKDTKAQAIIDKVATTNKVKTEVKELAINKTDDVISELSDKVEIDDSIDYTIKEVHLKNFEAFEDVTIQLNQLGPTLLIGESSQGKSAILRALYWTLENKGDGKSFVRRAKGIKEASVELIRADGTSVKRIIEIDYTKKGTVKVVNNGWIIKYTDGTVTETNTAGLEEVQNIFGMTYLVLDRKEQIPLNFLKQDDNHFFLSETPAKRAKIIGSLYETQYILAAIKNLESDRRKLETKRKVLVDEKTELENKLIPLADAEEKQNVISKIESELQNLENKQEFFDNLSSNFEEYSKLNSGIKTVNAFISNTAQSFSETKTEIDALKEKQNIFHSQKEYFKESNSLSEIIKEQQNFLKNKKTLEQLQDCKEKLIENYNSNLIVNKTLKELKKYEHSVNNLSSFIKEVSNISKLSKELTSLNDKIESLSVKNKEFKKLSEYSKLIKENNEEIKKISYQTLILEEELIKEKNNLINSEKINIQNFVLYNIKPGGFKTLENDKIKNLEERLSKMSNLLVRAQTKLEDAETRKEDTIKKLKELGVNPEDGEKELKKLEADIEKQYEKIESSLSKIEEEAEKMKQ